jgi:hypothetical protein
VLANIVEIRDAKHPCAVLPNLRADRPQRLALEWVRRLPEKGRPGWRRIFARRRSAATGTSSTCVRVVTTAKMGKKTSEVACPLTEIA